MLAVGGGGGEKFYATVWYDMAWHGADMLHYILRSRHTILRLRQAKRVVLCFCIHSSYLCLWVHCFLLLMCVSGKTVCGGIKEGNEQLICRLDLSSVQRGI